MYELPAVCRFCTKKTDLIYSLDDDTSSLIAKLATLAPDTVEFNDMLPQKICKSCHDKLNETYKFQQQIYHVFKIYKTFMEFQQSPDDTEGNVEANDEANAEANDEANAEANDEANAEANDEANAEANDGEANAEANDEANAEANVEVNGEAYEEANVEAYEEVNGEAYEEANVEAYEEANDEANVETNFETNIDANFEAYAEANIEAYAEGNIEAYAEGNIEAYAEGNIEAYAEGNIEAYTEANIENNETILSKTETFEYVDEEYISEDLKKFFCNMGNTSPPLINQTFIKIEAAKKPEAKRATIVRSKPSIAVVKRKRGRPRKYCGLMQFKNDDLTDVAKMKNVVVNALPNIDPDYEPDSRSEESLDIILRKKRGRPKTLGQKEENNTTATAATAARINETFIITEQDPAYDDVINEPGCSKQDPNKPKGTSKAPYWRKAV